VLRHTEPPDFGALMSLLANKHTLIEEMRALTREMQAALEGEEFDRLDPLLAARQLRMGELDAINPSIDLGYLAARPTMSEDGLRLFVAQDATAARLMHALFEEDKRLSGRMREVLAGLKHDVAGIGVQRRGLASYGETQRIPGGTLLDDKK